MVDFRIDVVIDPRGATTGTRVIERELVRVENRADAARLSIGSMLAILGGAGALTGAVRSLAAFEQSLATVRAVSGATAQEFVALREAAQTLGLTTRFSATEAGDALGELARAGFTVKESLEAVESTLVLATAGGLDLRTATDIAANALRGFRLETAQTGRVADVLAQAANASNTSVQELGDALKFVAPVAAGLRQSFEGTNAALGVLSDAGLKASLAGTGLRRVLSELESPSKASQEILASLGLTAEDVQVSQIGLVEALRRLKDASIDTGTAIELFGDRGGPAFEVLSNNIPRIGQLTTLLEKSGGTARKVAADLDNNLQGSLLRVQKAYQGLILELGDAGATSALTRFADNAANALRFLAQNIELTSGVAQALGGVIVATLIPSITRLATAVVATNPVIAAATAAFAAATIALSALEAENNAVSESFKQLEQDAKFGQIGAQIRLAQQELSILAKIQERSGSQSEAQAARVALLRRSIEAYRAEIKQETEDNKKLKEARDANTVSVDNSIAALDRRIARLRAGTRESELAAAAEAEIQKLLDGGVVPTQADQDAITKKLELIQALGDQRTALDEIRGPQEGLARQQAAINALFTTGRITAEEYRAALAKLGESRSENVGTDPLKDSLQTLRDTIEVETARLRVGELAATAIGIEQELRRQGITLTREQQDELAKLLIKQQEITGEQEKQNKARQAAEQQTQRLAALAAELDVNARLIQQEAELQLLRAQRPDLENEIAVALDNVKLRALEASNTLEAGFQRAFLKIKQEAEDFAAVGDAVVSTFADKATDAITEFALTGQFSFKEFASAILKDLTRIIARLLVVQALNAAVGAFGGGAAIPATTTVSGQFADGGTTQPGRSYLVGERGPELFTPGQTGSVAPMAAAAPAAPPVIQVVNVSDPNDVPNAINGGRADESILNVLARNPDRVKQLIT
jgi:TP901 family phage tail tape measure protein/lambda family phage tail tape measure protein